MLLVLVTALPEAQISTPPATGSSDDCDIDCGRTLDIIEDNVGNVSDTESQHAAHAICEMTVDEESGRYETIDELDGDAYHSHVCTLLLLNSIIVSTLHRLIYDSI